MLGFLETETTQIANRAALASFVFRQPRLAGILNDRQSMADLPKVLDMPVLMVVGLRLGCLNHAQLTRQAIETCGAKFAG